MNIERKELIIHCSLSTGFVSLVLNITIAGTVSLLVKEPIWSLEISLGKSSNRDLN